MSSAPLRARSPFFSFDTETGSRRPRRLAFVAGLLSVLLVAAGITFGVGAASAHTPHVTSDCYGVSVKLDAYNNHGNGKNSLKIVIDGVTKVDTADFGSAYPLTVFPFADPTKANTWSVKVVAHDDPQGRSGWSIDRSGTSTPCAPPGIDLSASVCNSVGGKTTLTARFSQLIGGQVYSAQLFKDGLPEGAAFIPSTVGDKVWSDMDAGHVYRLTVTNTKYPTMSKSVEAKVVGCPQNSALLVTVTECTSPTTADATVDVTASQLVVGRSYTATVWRGGAALTGAIPVDQGSSTSVTFSIPVPPSTSGMTVVLTDTGAGTTITSAPFAAKPCPSDPAKPTVTASTCTVVGGSLEITVSLDGLTPSRVYLVQIDGATVAEITAAATSQGGLTYPVAAGSHSVTILDKAVPSIAKTSDPVLVTACPVQPDVSLAIAQCSEPGGSGTLTASFAGLGAGRDYTVTINEGGSAVPGYPATTITAGAAPQVFSGLVPGRSYTVTVIDKLAPTVLDAASVTLTPCPQTPTVSLQLTCDLISGTSTIGVSLDKLVPGDNYTVSIEDDGGAPAGPPVTVTSSSTVAPSFVVPNGEFYTVSIVNDANAKITGSADIYAADCDLPTFPLPPELPTLALTGAGDTTMPMLGALGVVQFGVALLALAAMLQFAPRRRAA